MASSVVRKAAAATALLASVGLLAPMATANGDTRIPLAAKSKTTNIGSGGSITVSSKGERAILSPGMVALPSTRNAWVSGNISAKVNGKADGGTIEAGYLIGCQINISTAGINLGASADSGVGFATGGGANGENSPQGLSVAPKAGATTGGSISLQAGGVGTQSLTFDRATFPKAGDSIKPGVADDGTPNWATPSTDFDFDGNSGSFSYTDQTIGVDGCAGYAQARLYAIVTAQVGNSEGTVILWGDKFTMG